MAEQTAIDYESLEWKDDASGGTPIDAAALNRMEGGIADACAGVDELRTRRLPTYVVAQDGDTATQDVYSDDILGPCLILDLATRTTYYETGGDEDGHRKELVSGADVDEIRDSVSQDVKELGNSCFYWKVGRTVFVSVQGAAPLSSGSNLIGTLPKGYRPAHGKTESSGYVRVTGVVKTLGSSSASSTGTIDVLGGGEVRVWMPVATNDASPTSGQVFFDAEG